MNKISDIKETIDQAVQSLAGLGHLTEVLVAAAEVRSSIERLEAATNRWKELRQLLVPTGAKVRVPTRPNPYIPEGAQGAELWKTVRPLAVAKMDARKNAPPRGEVKGRILAKLKKEGQPMSQAALIRALHHDYYSVSTALASLQQAGEIKDVTVVVKGSSGQDTKRKVKAYVPA